MPYNKIKTVRELNAAYYQIICDRCGYSPMVRTDLIPDNHPQYYFRSVGWKITPHKAFCVHCK